MNIFNFESWATYKQRTQPNEGFNVSTDYSTPETETEKRNQLQSLHSQIKTFINTTIVAGINALTGRVEVNEGNITTLQSHEIENITSDETMTIRKVGKNISLSVNVSGSGEATKAYVDAQDTALSGRITANTGDISTNTANITALGGRMTTAEGEIDTLQAQIGVYSLWCGTQAEYDAIETKDTNTLYFIKES